jgi:phenylalanyl-tRNA synthetase beta chain
MNLSMKWLHDYVDIDVPMREFSETMTMSGSKVESYGSAGDEIQNVVAGKILSVEKHPDADKLVVCSLDVGSGEPIQIVTGATNVFAGAIVPVALNGSLLPGGKKIRKGKLRGVVSNGMLCSLGELGLCKNDFPYAIEDGIFIINEDCRPGQDIREVTGLDDPVVEFEITPNRPDCLSVIGLAREVAVTFNKKLTMPDAAVKGGSGKTGGYVNAVVHDPKLCTRYTARAVRNVKIGPSPLWMRQRLRSAGVRPINNIVDITNYVMLEYGQPMHAFDYRFIKGGTINVRLAQKGESITTLDGIKRPLDEKMLVIADCEKPVAVAGVMGGEFSGIMSDTETIVFESAMFDAASVRLTAKRLGMRTEASSRYEKGLDAQNTVPALDRACRLVELLGAGEVCGDYIDVDNSDKTPRTVPLDADWINHFLGTNIDKRFMIDTLRKLEFKVENDVVTVPSYRADVGQKPDIAEEVARIYGYNTIPTTMLQGAATRGGLTPAQKFEKKALQTLLALGYTEIATYSFISPKYYDKILMPSGSPLRNSIKILNPLGEDTGIMRTTTLPSMLETLARNYSNRNLAARLFEIGTVYMPNGDGKLPNELKKITLGSFGNGEDFYKLKGDVEELFENLGVSPDNCEYLPCDDEPAFHSGRCAKICVGGAQIGILGEIHPKVQANYGIDTRVYAAVIDAKMLKENSVSEKHYTPLPKFPSTARDIAVTCDEAVPIMELEKAMKSAAGKVIEKIELFDIYRGHQIPDGKKSVAFSVIMRAADRTLTDDEADSAVSKVLKALENLGAALRS